MPLNSKSVVSPVHSAFTISHETAICIETPSKNHSSCMTSSVKHTCYLQQLSNLTCLVWTYSNLPYYDQLQDTRTNTYEITEVKYVLASWLLFSFFQQLHKYHAQLEYRWGEMKEKEDRLFFLLSVFLNYRDFSCIKQT